jgi:hypothetical protein
LSDGNDLIGLVAGDDLYMLDSRVHAARPTAERFDDGIQSFVGDHAGVDFDQVVRRRAVKAESIVGAHLETDAPAIMEFIGRWDDWPEIETVKLADAAQRVVDALLLGFELCVVAQVLP